MTHANATKIMADYEEARLKTCAGSGNGSAFDRLAKVYGITPGEAMSWYYQAKAILEGPKPCAWCKGTGRA